MTKNFVILQDYNVSSKFQESIKKDIEAIENKIFNDNLDSIYIYGGKILEKIFQEQFGEELSLTDAIKKWIIKNDTPTKVKNAFYTIKTRRNEEVHVLNQNNKPYNLNNDVFTIVEFLKQIFIIIKYFVKMNNNNVEFNNEKISFDSSVYIQKIKNSKQEIEKITDVNNDEEYLQSELKSIFELISSDYTFLVPTYQREYKWNKDNINVLLQDIKDRTKDKKIHYMGSLALGIDKKNKSLILIDGQQRITTCLILLKVIISKFDKSKKLIMPKELNFIKDKLSNKYVNKIKKYGDVSYVKNILENSFQMDDNDFTKSHAYKNYEQIKDYLNNLDIKEFDEFYTCFFSKFLISEIRFIENLDQEMQIFENLNSKSMDLSQWDLIKNYFYKNVSMDLWIQNELEIDLLINRLFLNKSSKYFKNIKKDIHLSNFFALYCRIKSKLIDGKVLEDKGKIHKIFASQWPRRKNKKFKNIQDLKEELLPIAKLFEIYCIIISKDYLNKTSPLFQFGLSLENLANKNTHLPLIMNAIEGVARWDNILDNTSNDISISINKIREEWKVKLLNFISDVDKYFTRLMIVRNKIGVLSNLFDNCISKNIEDSHNKFIENILLIGKKSYIPGLEEFGQVILKKNDWEKPYAIAVMRTLSWNKILLLNESSDKVISKISLEHIFPSPTLINNNSMWFKETSNLSWDDFKDRTTSKVNKLGNYLLVISNKKIKDDRNKNFREKLETYRSFAIQILLSGNLENHQIMDLTKKEKFTMEDIEIRTQEITNVLLSLYKLSFEPKD